VKQIEMNIMSARHIADARLRRHGAPCEGSRK
jgi:hypothetical protein